MSKNHCKFKVRDVVFESGTHIMGILNVTPDSFFEGSRARDVDSALARAKIMLRDGAEILDIGGQSTRPGCEKISAIEEMSRLIPVVEAVRAQFPSALISADTFYASVAEEAAKAGADMINDVSCFADENMAKTIAKHGLSVCVMHNRRRSENRDMFEDKIEGLTLAADKLLETGTPADKILLDGGIGFNLSREEDVELLVRYGELAEHFDHPFLMGASRKSFLGGRVEDRLPASLEAVKLAVKFGVLFVRVHDVAQSAQAIAAESKS